MQSCTVGWQHYKSRIFILLFTSVVLLISTWSQPARRALDSIIMIVSQMSFVISAHITVPLKLIFNAEPIAWLSSCTSNVQPVIYYSNDNYLLLKPYTNKCIRPSKSQRFCSDHSRKIMLLGRSVVREQWRTWH